MLLVGNLLDYLRGDNGLDDEVGRLHQAFRLTVAYDII